MSAILNLTQHPALPEQMEAGVFDAEVRDELDALLTFDEPPTMDEMEYRAARLAFIAECAGADAAMIGGAPFFMSTLERALLVAGITPVYAFSKRVSGEVIQPDGSVRKMSIFRHAGFVSVDHGS
jgi:hypothetical protein